MFKSKAKIFFERGMQKCYQKDNYGAIDDFSKAIEIKPNYIDAYIKRAQTKCATQEVSQILEAYGDYDKAVQLDPNNAEALAGRGALSIQLNPEDMNGIQDLEKAAKINPEIGSWWNLGIARMQIGDYSGMKDAFHEFIKTSTQDNWQQAEAFYFLGVAYQNLKEWDNSIDFFSKAIKYKATQNYMWSFFNRAVSLSNIGELDRAVDDYTKVIQLKPDQIEAYQNRSKIYAAKKQDNLAIQDLKTALSYNNKNVEIIEDLVMRLVFSQQYKEALANVNELINLQPQAAHHYQNKGACYLGLKEYEEAIHEFTKAIELNRNASYAYYYRGLCHINLNNNVQACIDWKTAYNEGCDEAKNWIDKYCNDLGFEIDGEWYPLDMITSKPGG